MADILESIFKTYNLSSKGIKKHMELNGHDLNFSDVIILKLSTEKNMTFGKIKERTQLAQSSISTICKKLIENKYIHRHNYVYEITDSGRKALKVYSGLIEEINDSISLNLSGKDEFNNLISKIGYVSYNRIK